MKIYVIDITNRNAVQYNPALCSALAKESPNDDIVLLSTRLNSSPNGYKFKKLISLISEKSETSVSKSKRLLRAIEVLINYFYLFIYTLFTQPDVLHIQWLPLVDFSSIESFILGSLKFICPKMKIFLTVHNVFPHNMAESKKQIYIKRFNNIGFHIDGYLVHLESTRQVMHDLYGVPLKKLHVAYHGIYVSDSKPNSHVKEYDGKCRIIMYGKQTPYKGADILIEALKLLPQSYLAKTFTLIMGQTDANLYDKCQSYFNNLNVKWINRFVSDEELYSSIDNSSLILLPYRAISQSGVLLLALSYKKPILTSDLPSFKETLEGYPSEYFFESENTQSLAKLLMRFIDGQIDNNQIITIIEGLNDKYSWGNTAIATINAYHSCYLV